MSNLFALRLSSAAVTATFALAVFQYGVLTVDKINSHLSTPVSYTLQSIEQPLDIATEEQRLLRKDANDTKLEHAKKNIEEAKKPGESKPSASQKPVAQATPSDVPSTPKPVPVAPVAVPPVVPSAETYVQSLAPVTAPVVAAPVVPVPPPVVKPVPAQVAVPYSLPVYVGLSGGQETIDLCAGPVLFTTATLPYPYIAEHEDCGGWARFSGLQIGSRVSLSGLVGGEFSVGQILTVNKTDTTAALTFGSSPRAILQTCIPGTNKMLVYGLY